MNPAVVAAALAVWVVVVTALHVGVNSRRPLGRVAEAGYAFIRRVRALDRQAGGGTPAVALTAYARTKDRDLAVSPGYTMHVPKPVDPGEFAATVASLAAAGPA